MRIPAAVLLLAFALGATAADKIYRWTDADGTVHYGDRPPGQAEELTVRVPRAAVPAEAETPSESPQTAAVDCETLRGNLDLWRDAETLIQRDALGNEVTLSADQRQQLLTQTEAQIAQDCGAAPR